MSSMNSSKVLLLAVGSVTCQAGFYPLDVTAEWGAGKNSFSLALEHARISTSTPWSAAFAASWKGPAIDRDHQ